MGEKERGPKTVVNTSKKAADQQPFITQSDHFAYKHLDTSSYIPEVEWVPPPHPKSSHKVTRTPSDSNAGVPSDSWGDPRTLGYHLAFSHLATPTLILPLGDHRANTGNHMVEQGVRKQRKCSVKF